MNALEPIWLDPLVNFGAVLLGAGLAWGTSYFFEIKRKRDEELARAYSLVFKVQELVDDVVKLERHIASSFEAAEAKGAEGPAWTKILDIVGFERSLEPISPDELALIAKTKDPDFTMRVKELESGHSIALAAFSRITQMKAELGERGAISGFEGATISIEVSPQEHAQLAPILINLESASRGLLDLLPKVTANAREVANTIGGKLKDRYKFEHFIELDYTR